MKEQESYEELVEQLKQLPKKEVSSAVNQRFEAMEELWNKETHRKSSNSPKWYGIAASIAALIALLLWWPFGTSIQDHYSAMEDASDKMAIIHELSAKTLQDNDVAWLGDVLKTEENPNIRVFILDLLEIHESAETHDLLNPLQEENVPAVQMAYLNLARQFESEEIMDQLVVFQRRTDLDPSVTEKVATIISEINNN